MQQIIARDTKLPGAAQGASSTAEFQFQNSDETPSRAIVKIDGDQLRGKEFHVIAGGRAIAGAAGNLTINIDAGGDSVIANNTTIATSGAKALTDAVSGTWFLKTTCMIDAVSGRLEGYLEGWVNETAVAQAINTAPGAEFDLDGEVVFTLTGTFSVSDADNAAVCEFFKIVA